MKFKRTAVAVLAASLAVAGLTACESAADVANDNLTKAAENFEVPRRIIGINTRFPDKPLFEVTGYCSYETNGDTIEAICATNGANRRESISRTTLGKAADVTFVSTQLEGVKVDFFKPRIIFRPETIIPNYDLSTSINP